MVALFPDDTSRAEQYLSDSGLAIPEIKRSNLGVLGITGTPTVLIVTKDGIVANAWEGKLPLAVEEEVLRALE